MPQDWRVDLLKLVCFSMQNMKSNMKSSRTIPTKNCSRIFHRKFHPTFHELFQTRPSFSPEDLRGPLPQGYEFFEDGAKVLPSTWKVHGGPNLGAFNVEHPWKAQPWNLGGASTDLIFHGGDFIGGFFHDLSSKCDFIGETWSL